MPIVLKILQVLWQVLAPFIGSPGRVLLTLFTVGAAQSGLPQSVGQTIGEMAKPDSNPEKKINWLPLVVILGFMWLVVGRRL